MKIRNSQSIPLINLRCPATSISLHLMGTVLEKVFGGFGEGVWRVWRVLEGFGAFAAWQTAALKANRKPLLWPWPWGACWGRCVEGLEGFGEFGGLWPWPWGACLLRKVCGWFGGFWRVWKVLESFGGFAAWQTAALKANRKPLLWPWPWGACWGRCLEGLEGFGGVWRVWRVLEGFGRFWRVCGLANGSFESQ